MNFVLPQGQQPSKSKGSTHNMGRFCWFRQVSLSILLGSFWPGRLEAQKKQKSRRQNPPSPWRLWRTRAEIQGQVGFLAQTPRQDDLFGVTLPPSRSKPRIQCIRLRQGSYGGQEGAEIKGSKFQAPSSSPAVAGSMTKHQTASGVRLEFGAWSFSGAWMLVLGSLPLR